MKGNLEVNHVTKSDLKIALQNNTYWKGNSVIPFTKSKAFWLLDNERIEEHDLCSVMVHENDRLVAFVYLIADWITTPSGMKKIYWCRRWWVADDYKSSILSTFVMKEAVSATKQQILLKFLGKTVIEYFKNQPYVEFSHRTRYFIVSSLITSWVLRRFKFLKVIKPIIQAIDMLSGRLINYLNHKKIQKKVIPIQYEYLSTIDQTTWAFLQDKLKNDLIPKTKEYINWQLSSRQYTQTLVAHKFPHSCLIAGASTNMYIVNFNVVLSAKIIGFISVLIRTNEYQVKYFVAEEEYYDICVAALIQNFHKTKTNTIYTEDNKLGKFILKNYHHIYVDKRSLYALAHHEIDHDFSKEIIHDRDANYA
ncbi:hypothetical protein J8281_07380 [Aquimarina sp. U1-2]|uniref:hypothetical protein n=1 Tax=Aquimarina sp. U1-2 TaxID=2823141 RepID=UPI001AECC99D|nr:hypothetical protein [Aquimarina sp. U1-2]MBP2832009.1 hypothetical protein [Aquimarina sp. U1-2]